MNASRLALLAMSSSLFVACAVGEATSQSADMTQQPEELCTATLSVLQKDAYKETAGKSDALWPPHTTTVLTVSCSADATQKPVVIAEPFMANHGTKPGAVDANGDVILVEVASAEVEATRAELLELATAFEACDCEASTQFLSTDALDDAGIQKLIGSLTDYMSQNLVCEGDVDADGLAELLLSGQVAAALAVLPNCTWSDDRSLEEGLNDAVLALEDEGEATLAGYHLCNNDASLQVELFKGFSQTGVVNSCDSTSPLCAGPQWFYTPDLQKQ